MQSLREGSSLETPKLLTAQAKLRPRARLTGIGTQGGGLALFVVY